MAEAFVKKNDYTLDVVDETTKTFSSYDNDLPLTHVSSLTRTFNFMAGHVTTVTRDLMFQSHAYEKGGSSAVATTSATQNFDELPSTAEVELMHSKLISLGGKPPALEAVLGGLNKKAPGLKPA
ncbi:MAG: hypothetical protein PW788_10590 [Micavibrio sp.]|nr:hypothetical protein [Micavibrio sp.]